MPLRPYQTELITRTRKSWAAGHKRPCIVLGCGGGKSVIVAEIARKTTENKKRVLFIVHRKELCDQIRKTFEWWGVDTDYCTIGMVQTITRRITKIRPPALIITDENHHCLANSYRRIYESFPDAYCVGVTATPVRLDGSGLGDVNDDLVIGPPTRWLIDNGYLAPYQYYSVKLIDTDAFKTRRGEYDLTGVVLDRKIYGDVIQSYRRFADGLKAICYCPSIPYSEQMAERFRAAGIPSAHIDGSTDKRERDQVIQDFRDGKIQVLCNVDLISEGFDVSDCGAAILLRPTKSLTLYIQQAMRCMRYKPGKTAVIIDHVGNVFRHGFPDDNRDWDLYAKPDKKAREKPEVRAKECPECMAAVPSTAAECPHCGYKFRTEGREIEEDGSAKIEEIKRITADYTRPGDCRSYRELLEYAKNHGYRPGWAFYRAKERGYL